MYSGVIELVRGLIESDRFGMFMGQGETYFVSNALNLLTSDI